MIGGAGRTCPMNRSSAASAIAVGTGASFVFFFRRTTITRSSRRRPADFHVADPSKGISHLELVLNSSLTTCLSSLELVLNFVVFSLAYRRCMACLTRPELASNP